MLMLVIPLSKDDHVCVVCFGAMVCCTAYLRTTQRAMLIVHIASVLANRPLDWDMGSAVHPIRPSLGIFLRPRLGNLWPVVNIRKLLPVVNIRSLARH